MRKRLEGVAQHGLDLGAGVQLPGLGVLEQGVGLADDAPGGVERGRGSHLAPGPGGGLVGVGDHGREGAVGPGRGPDAVTLLADDGGDPRQQVAEVVGQVAVVALDHALVAEVAVGADRGVAQEVVAEPVDPELLDQVGRRDLVHGRLAHLLAADQQEPVHGDVGGRLEARGQQHRRPVHAVEPQDVLADDVVGGPPGGEALVVGAVADGGEVVDQGVEPHIGDVRRVPRDGHAPADRAAADREVVEAAPDEAQGLVALGLGAHEAGMGGVPVEQRLLEAGELEEVVLLLHVLDRPVVDGAQRPVDQVVDRVVGLARHAVQALVRAELDVAVVVDPLQDLLHGGVVAGLAGADEVVVRDVEQLPGVAEALGGAVGPLERRDPVGLGRPLDLQAVLVGAGEEERVVAQQPVPPGDRVRDDGRVRVPDVGRVVHVIDRRRQVELGHGL